MTEYEAFDVSIQLLGFNHELGEAINSRIEFWSGVSFGLIALAYIAPEKLSWGISILLLVIYSLFSISLFQDIAFDMETVFAITRDTLSILESNSLSFETARQKVSPWLDDDFTLSRAVSNLYLPGLFFGTIGYLGVTTYRQRRISASGNES